MGLSPKEQDRIIRRYHRYYLAWLPFTPLYVVLWLLNLMGHCPKWGQRLLASTIAVIPIADDKGNIIGTLGDDLGDDLGKEEADGIRQVKA